MGADNTKYEFIFTLCFLFMMKESHRYLVLLQLKNTIDDCACHQAFSAGPRIHNFLLQKEMQKGLIFSLFFWDGWEIPLIGSVL